MVILGFLTRLSMFLRVRTVPDEFLFVHRVPSPGLGAQHVVNCCSSNCMRRGSQGSGAGTAHVEINRVAWSRVDRGCR